MNKYQNNNRLASRIRTSDIKEVRDKEYKVSRAREDLERVRVYHDFSLDSVNLSDNKYTLHSSKLNCCPFSKSITKYIPVLGKSVKLVVPCGKCHFCLHRKQNAWIYRAFNHSQYFKYKFFVTLTFNPENYPCESEQDFRHLQLFFKRFRKNNGNIRFTYFAVSEFGRRTGRFHYHFLYFSNTPISRTSFKQKVEEAWKLGFVHVGSVSNQSIAYVTKYSVKDNKSHRCVSKHFGEDYIYSSQAAFDFFRYNPLVTYSPDNKMQYTIPVPKYYKSKVLSDAERYYLFERYLQSPDYLNKCIAFPRDYNPASADIVLHYYSLYNQYCINHVESRERISKLNDVL